MTESSAHPRAQAAVAAHPRSAVAHFELGVAARGLERWAEALVMFGRALALLDFDVALGDRRESLRDALHAHYRELWPGCPAQLLTPSWEPGNDRIHANLLVVGDAPQAALARAHARVNEGSRLELDTSRPHVVVFPLQLQPAEGASVDFSMIAVALRPELRGVLDAMPALCHGVLAVDDAPTAPTSPWGKLVIRLSQETRARGEGFTVVLQGIDTSRRWTLFRGCPALIVEDREPLAGIEVLTTTVRDRLRNALAELNSR